jgi:hypothetical protein
MARTAPAYCEVSDLVLGDLAMPRGVSKEEWVAKGADEIDAYLGQIYRLPLDLDPNIPPHRQDLLLLNKINSFLSSGRLLLMIALANEDNSVHAYGKSLVDEATRELARITAGRTVIEGADLLVETSEDEMLPIVTNRDSGSYLDAFYNSSGTAQQAAAYYAGRNAGILPGI